MGFPGIGWKKRIILPAVLLGVLGILAAVFFLRAPVLIMSDEAFNGIYGQRRRVFSQVSSSLSLFRRVKLVTIADSAGPDIQSFAAEAAHPAPHAVLFPSRYRAGAERYAVQFPDIPVIILEGRNGNPSVRDNIYTLCTDNEDDCYRAASAATLIAGEGKILVFYDTFVKTAERAVISRALEDTAFRGTIEFVQLGSVYGSYAGVSAVILCGPAPAFLQEKLDTPVLLFSWIDPALTPREVKLIFDDSPWAMAVPAVRMAAGEKRADRIPSKAFVLGQRIPKGPDKRELRRSVRTR